MPNHSKIRIFKKIYQGDPQNLRVREIRLSSVRPSLSDHLCWRPSLLEGDVGRTSTHFIRNCTGFCRIPPLRWVSACQRTGLTGLSTAAKGVLDTIALALTTGNPGEVFAAAFDKREQVQLVLAKDGPPTLDDIAAAREFISLIESPAVLDAIDIFPFLIRRCGANINKRIHNLHTSIQDGELRNDFTLALEAYSGGDIIAEFPTTEMWCLRLRLCGKILLKSWPT